MLGVKRHGEQLESPSPAKQPRISEDGGILPGIIKSFFSGFFNNAREPVKSVQIRGEQPRRIAGLPGRRTMDDDDFPPLGLGGQPTTKKSQLPPAKRPGQSNANPTRSASAPGAANTAWARKPPMHVKAHDAFVQDRTEQQRAAMAAKYDPSKMYQALPETEGLKLYGKTLRPDEHAQWNELKDSLISVVQPKPTLEQSLSDRMADLSMRRAQGIKAKSDAEPRKPATPLLDRARAQAKALDEDLEGRKLQRRLFPVSLGADEDAVVRKALRTPANAVVSTMPGAEVCGRDIQKLAPREWLNDEIINFYGVLIAQRSKAYEEELAKMPADKRPPLEKRKYLAVHVFSSFFLTKLAKDGYAGVRRWSKKRDLFALDAVLVPVNMSNTHWTAACINIRKKRFEYYDSMGHPNRRVFKVRQKCRQLDLADVAWTLRDYLKAEHKDKKGTELDLSDWSDYEIGDKAPQQENAFDCGVFTSQIIECLSRPNSALDYTQENMPYLRKKMVYEITKQKLVTEEFQ